MFLVRQAGLAAGGERLGQQVLERPRLLAGQPEQDIGHCLAVADRVLRARHDDLERVIRVVRLRQRAGYRSRARPACGRSGSRRGSNVPARHSRNCARQLLERGVAERQHDRLEAVDLIEQRPGDDGVRIAGMRR